MITDHHDGFGLNEALSVEPIDEIGPGGSHHEYEIRHKIEPDRTGEVVAHVQFQKGPRNEPGSTAGATTASVITLLLDHLRAFQAGEYPSRETAIVITKLEEALMWTHARARNRAKRGVLGKYEK